ncbi:FRG domain-containing protein [Vreelandella arcis]|uniref:FRG domain-containing protein n=1 Tax=Vreelandella arcis TaxID=416873 RepID=A0A1H0J6I1_9GAMM|nr:FRG domain-containing protein [Halomonas arcis]SDO39264.1 FRG domain-containing protein [Halomonas arcis]
MYQLEDFETARELIEYLSPLNRDRWPRGEYVFRGQPCASYSLTPSAYRSKGFLTSTAMLGRFGAVKGGGQVYFEVMVLSAFLEACDGAGIQVPGDSMELRSILESPDNYTRMPTNWPPRTAFPVLATAQHHGVPTCLLDWTRRSYVAAYFAASGILRSEPKNSHLAIWALRVFGHKEWENIAFVEMPGGTSANLAAQEGVFTVSSIKAGGRESFEHLPLEREQDVYKRQADGFPSLVKLTLPVEEAGNLLQFCIDLGVKGSVLFPGYEGAAREVNDYAYASQTRYRE